MTCTSRLTVPEAVLAELEDSSESPAMWPLSLPVILLLYHTHLVSSLLSV